MGVLDGMLFAPALAATKLERALKLHACIVAISEEQAAAIVTRYLEQHPEEWHQGAHAIVFRAFVPICRL